MQIRAEAKTNNRTINKQLIKNKRKSSYPINHQVKWSKKTPFAKTVKKSRVLWQDLMEMVNVAFLEQRKQVIKERKDVLIQVFV